MKIEFDPVKSAKNAEERGLPFERVGAFEWDTSFTEEDRRFAYPERRLVTTGLIGGRVHVICHTPIDGGIRVISFRKANVREVQNYEQEKAAHRQGGGGA